MGSENSDVLTIRASETTLYQLGELSCFDFAKGRAERMVQGAWTIHLSMDLVQNVLTSTPISGLCCRPLRNISRSFAIYGLRRNEETMGTKPTSTVIKSLHCKLSIEDL